MDLEQVKNILSSVLGTVSEKGKEYAGVAMDKTKAAGRLAHLSLELTSEKEALRKAYAEIGQAYYEGHRESAEGVFVQLCEEVDTVKARVSAMEAEIAELKSSLHAAGTADEPDVDVTFESVVEEDEKQGEAAPAEDKPADDKPADDGKSE